MSSSETSSSGGIGFVGLLTITFVVLRLCEVVDWSWWWVLSPVWISTGVIALVLIIIALIGVIMITLNSKH